MVPSTSAAAANVTVSLRIKLASCSGGCQIAVSTSTTRHLPPRDLRSGRSPDERIVVTWMAANLSSQSHFRPLARSSILISDEQKIVAVGRQLRHRHVLHREMTRMRIDYHVAVAIVV